MRTTNTAERSGNAIASFVSAVGLVLVWTVIWANFPSQEELFSAQSTSSIAETQRVPALDLTIPGVVSQNSAEPASSSSATALGGLSVPSDSRARQIAEVKCEAEVQSFCPDSLSGEARRRCVIQRTRQLDTTCQQIVRRRLVRWREAEEYKLVCVDDVKRFCPVVQPGDGRILQCLQEHEQDLSESCYQSLPKGRLNFRN